MIDAWKLLKLGPPIRQSDAAWDADAAVGELDVQAARLLWHRAAPDDLRGLLDSRLITAGDVVSDRGL
jgi:hypothetical protein